MKVINSPEVELIEVAGGDVNHALSAWTSTVRKLTPKRVARMEEHLRMLMFNEHHSPFEKSYIEFLVRTDQASHIHLLKHRIGVSINGESARYKELKSDIVYIPPDFPTEEKERLLDFQEWSLYNYHRCLSDNENILGRKRAKESCRFYLPYSSTIELSVSFNFRSFLHFYQLRHSEHAQREIYQVADSMMRLLKNTGKFDLSIKVLEELIEKKKKFSEYLSDERS